MTVVIPRDGGSRRRRSVSSRAEKRKTPPGDRLELMLRAHGIGGWQREFRFHPDRRWRFDFAWPQIVLPGVIGVMHFAIEIEGISGGMRPVRCRRCEQTLHHCGATVLAIAPSGHQTAKGMREDIEKYHEALRLGWIVYRTHQDEVESAHVIGLIRQFIGDGGPMPAQQPQLVLPEPAEESPF